MLRTGYVVNNKCDSDNEIALEFALLHEIATSRNKAWEIFLDVAGKDREYWNKKGYIAEKIQYEINFIK